MRVQVRMSSRELNRLYLSGDTLILLPVDGMTEQPKGAPIPRSSMFLSEIAGSQEGFTRAFVDASSAERFADDVRIQISTALEAS